jgi:hypothetical protein
MTGVIAIPRRLLRSKIILLFRNFAMNSVAYLWRLTVIFGHSSHLNMVTENYIIRADV